MSEHSISIVPKLSVYPDKESKAKHILEWLVSLDIVKPTLSDCVLSSNGGYAISDGARSVTAYPAYLPYTLICNGLEIITDRQVFHTGGNGIEEVTCPNCQQSLSHEDWDFLNEWHENTSHLLTCPLCNTGTDIHQFRFVPEWGFSDLGFTFWNWPLLKQTFVQQFKQRLACDCNLVYTKI